MITNNHKQIIKFAFLCFVSIIGTYFYIVSNGSLSKAFLIYLGFAVVSKTANVGYHRWLAHNAIEPGVIGRVIILWCMVSTLLSKPLPYIIGHRLHHRFSDTDKDPHHTKLGLWNHIIGNFNLKVSILSVPIKDYFSKKDVVFVNKYFYHLYFLNILMFWFIDQDIVLLSFLLLNLRAWVNTAVFNYIAHGGIKGQSPVNLPAWTAYILGYAGEQLHKNHHDNPSLANFGRTSFFNVDIIYYICKNITKVKN